MTMKINLGRNGRVGVEKEECYIVLARLGVRAGGLATQINLLAAGIPTRRAIFPPLNCPGPCQGDEEASLTPEKGEGPRGVGVGEPPMKLTR